LSKEGDVLDIGYSVGGGGGHRISIEDITLFKLNTFWKQKYQNEIYEKGILEITNANIISYEKSD